MEGRYHVGIGNERFGVIKHLLSFLAAWGLGILRFKVFEVGSAV